MVKNWRFFGSDARWTASAASARAHSESRRRPCGGLCARLLVAVLVAGSLSGPGFADEPEKLSSSLSCELSSKQQAQFASFEFDTAEAPATPALGQTEVIQKLLVVRQQVFQTEDHLLQRLANRYHWQTREAVVRQVLPFAAGDKVDALALAEAERILRRKPYYFDGQIVPALRCPKGLLLVVVVRDVWTLNPRLIFSRSGGDNDVGAGVSDTNWFGTGIAASVGYLRNDERSGVNLVFRDSNLGGSRWALDSQVFHTDDGGNYSLDVGRPFYSERTKSAVGFRLAHHRRDQPLYFLEDELWELKVRTQQASAFVGRLLHQDGKHTTRAYAGLAYEQHELSRPLGFPDPVSDRRFVYPYLGWQRLSRRFLERRNIDRVQRTEDLALGSQLYLQLGYTPGIAGDDKQWLFNGSYRQQDWWRERWLLTLQAQADGRYNSSQSEVQELVSKVQVDAQQHQSEHWRLLLRAQARYTKNLPIDRQLLMGGRTGLRGYPNRYQVGDRAFLLTAEERYYSDRYPLQMFRLGGAAFVDVGRAWYGAEAPAWIPSPRRDGHFETLVNVGVGLRLESTRTRRDRVLHIDFAVPLVKGPRVRSLEVTLVARQSL